IWGCERSRSSASCETRANPGNGIPMDPAPLSGGMGSAYGERVYVFAHIRDLATFEFPDVRPPGAGIFARTSDAHRETPQNDHLVALRDEFLRLEFDNILNLGHSAEELRYLLAPMPGSGKRHICHLGHYPVNIVGEQVQKGLKIARHNTLIRLLH